MAFDDAKNEKRKQDILKKFIPSGPAENLSPVEEIAMKVSKPFSGMKQNIDQGVRNMEANMLSPNVVGDVSPENLARMQLNDVGAQQSPENVQASVRANEVAFEPAVMGTVGEAKLVGNMLVRPNTGYGKTVLADGKQMLGDQGIKELREIVKRLPDKAQESQVWEFLYGTSPEAKKEAILALQKSNPEVLKRANDVRKIMQKIKNK